MTIRATLTAALLACAAALPAAAQELKFANFTPPAHTINASVIEKMNADLSAATDGAVTVRGYHGGELGAGPVEQYVRVVQGAADLAWGLPGYTSSQFGKTMIAEMPDALAADRPGYEALWDAFEGELAGEFPGTVPVALWTSEPNIFIMRDKVIRTPADLAGLKVRVAGASSAEVAEALGATPVQMPINQVYQALETGLIDGVITGASVLSDFRMDEVANAITVGAPLGRLTFYTVMNQGAFDALPDAAREALDMEGRRALSQSAEEAWNATADAALEAARADAANTVTELTEDEAAAFAEAVSAVTQAYVDGVGGQAAADAMAGAAMN